MSKQLAISRARRPRNPRDVTGTRWAQQQAEQEAKKAAPAVTLEQAHKLIYERAFEAGQKAFARALYAMYKSDGIEAVQEYLAELDAVEAEVG